MSGFHQLLERLDADPARAAAEFERLRRTLCKFFDWRGATSPEDAADETLERLARKLEEEVAVQDIPAFAHGIARLVLHESQRKEAKQTSLDGMELPAPAVTEAPESDVLLQHLRFCLAALPRDGRDLLLAYYASGDGAPKIEGRQRLADQFRLSGNALRSRVQRLRDRIEECVRGRCPRPSDGDPPGSRHVFPPSAT